MSEKDSAGVVSLDLVIENTAEQQIQKIAKSAVEPAKKHFSAVGKGINSAVSAQIDGIKKNINDSISKPLEKASQAFKEPKSLKIATDSIGLMEQKINNVYAQMGALENKLALVEAEYEKIGKEKGFDSEEAVKLENAITSIQGNLISLQSTAISTSEKLQKTIEAPAKAAEKAAEQARREAEKAAEKIANEMERAAQKSRQAFEKAYNEIISNAQKAQKQSIEWAMRAEKANSRSASRAAKHAEKAFSRQAKAAAAYANKYADAQSDAAHVSVKALEKAHKRMEKAAQKSSKAAIKASKKMAKDSAGSASSMGRAFERAGKTIKSSLKAVFVTAVLYKFFKAFKDNISGALSKNKAFAKSLNEIKANLSVAFTPIIEAVMPLINRLAQGIATVTKYIATFIAAIFGKTYKQAVNSTKKLQGEAKKVQASTSRDFDELHNVDKNEDSDESGVNYDALDTSQLNTGPMQKFQEILEKIKTTIDKVKPAFKELYDKGIKPIAKWIGEKLKDAFKFLGEQLNKVGDWFVKHKDSFAKLGESLGKLWKALEPILNAAWETIRTAVSGLFDGLLAAFGSIVDIAPNVVDFVTALFTGDWEEVKETGKNILKGLWNGIKEEYEILKEFVVNLFNGLIDIVKTIFGIHSPSTVFSDIGGNLIKGLIEGISNVWETLKTVFTEKIDNLKASVKQKFSSVKDTILETFDSLKDGLNEKLSAIWNKFKEFINKIFGGVENMINKPISALNKLIDKLNSLKVDIPSALGGGTIGFNIGKFSQVSIPRLARGGIVDKPTLSLIGEAGKEAVVPLQNNTEWMEKLSAMFGNTIAAVLVPILQNCFANKASHSGGEKMSLNIDGKTFAEIIIDVLKKYPQTPDLNLI